MTKYGTKGTLRPRKPAENYALYDEIDDNLETIGVLAAVLIVILLMAAGAAWWLLW